MSFVRAAWNRGFLALLLALAGCGDNGMADVKGNVRVDGTPIEIGIIRFEPVDGKAQPTGGTIKDGLYFVPRVPVGITKVSISSPKVVGHKKLYPTPDSPVMPVTAEALPAKYNEQTELRFEVTPGKVQKDFELLSK